MFKDECMERATKWNLERADDPVKALIKIKEKFIKKALAPELNCDIWGNLTVSKNLRLSQEGYQELKTLCEEEGIELVTHWHNPFKKRYVFKMQFQ